MVFPMFVGAAVFMWLGSILTSPPTRATIDRYFPPRRERTMTQAGAPEAALAAT